MNAYLVPVQNAQFNMVLSINVVRLQGFARYAVVTLIVLEILLEKLA